MLLRFATIAAAVVLTACQGIRGTGETIAEVGAAEIAGVWVTQGPGDAGSRALMPESVREQGAGSPPESMFRPVADDPARGDADRGEGLRLPATFAGEGITFTLWSDGTFRLRESVGRAEGRYARHDLGRWEASGRRLWLRGRAEAPRDYRRLPGGGLQAVRPDGTPVEGGPTLRQTTLDLIGGPLWLTGELVYFADAAAFRECLSGRRLPVAMEGGWIDLERAYLADRPGPGEALLVGVIGRFVHRPPMEGEGMREFLRVEGFGATWPESECPGRRGDATLRNTRWQPLVIDGRLLPVLPEPHRMPHVRLLPDGRVSGSGGCNMFSGSVSAGEGSIRFGADMASTLMACREPVQALEQAFFSVLERATRYRVSGDRLDLFGADGEHLAHLQATYLD